MEKNIVRCSTGSRRTTICERARVERPNLGNYTTRWTKWSTSESSVARATRKLGRFYETTMEFARQKTLDLHNNIYKVNWIYVQACENVPTSQQDNSRESCRNVSQILNLKIDLFVDVGASLHLRSKKELTPLEKGTIRRWKESTVITTTSGKAELTEQATVFVNDLDVFVTMIRWKIHRQCYLWFTVRRHGLLL